MRILALLRLLSQGHRPTVHELAAEFRTRRETIYRDLRVLQDAGYPIAGDERGRLSRPRLIASPIPDIRFASDEVDALLVAVAQTQAALPSTGALASAVLKLRALADLGQVTNGTGLEGVFETWACGWKDYRAHDARIGLLIEAILRKKRCAVEYRRPSAMESKTYDFDPYRFLFVGGGLYVVGRVPKHDGTATLAVDRLVSVILSDHDFQVDSSFDPKKCRRNAFGVSWQDPVDVVLRFGPEQAPYVRERVWHPTQSLTDLPDGGVQLNFRAGGPFEIRRWVLGWGDAVEVISPEDLRQSVMSSLRAAKSTYEN